MKKQDFQQIGGMIRGKRGSRRLKKKLLQIPGVLRNWKKKGVEIRGLDEHPNIIDDSVPIGRMKGIVELERFGEPVAPDLKFHTM